MTRKEVIENFKNDAQEMAKNDESICSATFTMQKELQLPHVDLPPVYFMDRLCVFHFMIHNMGNDNFETFLWNETVGGRGVNETPAIIWIFIKKKIEEGTRDFLLFSGNCDTDNRKEVMFSMLVKAVAMYGINISYRYDVVFLLCND